MIMFTEIRVTKEPPTDNELSFLYDCYIANNTVYYKRLLKNGELILGSWKFIPEVWKDGNHPTIEEAFTAQVKCAGFNVLWKQ